VSLFYGLGYLALLLKISLLHGTLIAEGHCRWLRVMVRLARLSLLIGVGSVVVSAWDKVFSHRIEDAAE
jgi:hypothetical protein